MAQAKKKSTKKKTVAKKKSNKPSRNKTGVLLDGNKDTEVVKRQPGETRNEKDKQELLRRASLNRIVRQEDLRERIKSGNYLRFIRDINTELMGIVDRTKQKAPISQGENRKLSARLKALKQASDNHFRMLNKLLPDERALELRDPAGKDPFISLADVMKTALNDDGGDVDSEDEQ